MKNTILLLLTVSLIMLPLAPAMSVEGQDNSGSQEDAPAEESHIKDYELIYEDSNGNKLFDQLIVIVTFSFKMTDNSTLLSVLSCNEGSGDEPTIQRFDHFEQGEAQVKLTFPGTDIYRYHMNPPYNLHLMLQDPKRGVKETDIALEGDVPYVKYESPFDVRFQDTILYYGIDTDGNSEFDGLVVELTYLPRKAGSIAIVGELWGPSVKTLSFDATQIEISNGISSTDGTRDEDTENAEGVRGDGNDLTINDTETGKGEENGDPTGQLTAKGEPIIVPYKPNLEEIPYNEIVGSAFNSTDEVIPAKENKMYLTFTNLKYDLSTTNVKTAQPAFIISASIFFDGIYIEKREWEIKKFNPEPPKVYGHFIKDNARWHIKRTREGSLLAVDVKIDVTWNFTLEARILQDANTAGVSGSTVEVFKNSWLYDLDKGTHTLELFLKGQMLPHGTKIYLTLITNKTRGYDQWEIRVPIPPADEIDATMKDSGEGKTKDNGFEFLHVVVSAGLPSGHYDYRAWLYSLQNGDGRTISSISGEIPGNEDSADEIRFSIDFPGEDIYFSGADGPYVVVIHLTAENGTVYILKGDTSMYKSDDFSPQDAGEGTGSEPEFTVTNNSLFLHTDVFASQVFKKSPELVFYYYTDMGESMKFKVRFTKLIAFNDDGNGIYDEGEESYEAILSTKNWVMSKITHGLDRKLGSYIAFNMSTDLHMLSLDNDESTVDVYYWGILTLHFLIANNTVDEVDLKIRGGEELKITVEIIQNIPILPVNAVALEQTIVQERNGLSVTAIDDSGNAHRVGDNGINWDINNGSFTSFRFQKEDGEIMGYYSWEPTAIQHSYEGNISLIDVGASASMDDEAITLFLSYNLSTDVAGIQHDPSVGVVRENAPVPVIHRITEEMGSPLGYTIGIIIAVMVVFLTLLGRSSRKTKEIT